MQCASDVPTAVPSRHPLTLSFRLSDLVAGVIVSLAVMALGPVAMGADHELAAEPSSRGDQEGESEFIDPNQILQFVVEPRDFELVGRDSRQQLLVSVHLAPDREASSDDAGQPVRWHDATRLASYTSLDPSVAEVTSLGVIHPVGSGVARIHVALGDEAAQVTVNIADGESHLPIDFRRDIIPILTKAGCNGGGCHGKSGGRGGLQLSLFGFDPEADHRDIVQAARGRRLFPASPRQSLILQKPVGDIPHVGGIRFDREDVEYQRLARWIEEGAQQSVPETAELERIEVTPTSRALGHFARQQLVATAVYQDGSRRDVTRTTEFHSNDPSVAEITRQGLLTTRDRTGETAIVAQHHGHVTVCRIQVPLVENGNEQSDTLDLAGEIVPHRQTLPIANFIDEHVSVKLDELRLTPSSLTDDYTFLRRVTLQIAGRLPTREEIDEFVHGHENGSAGVLSDKRIELVDRLLVSSEYADHFAQKWADILRNKRRGQADRILGTVGFHRWLRNAIAVNMPYDQFVEQIVTASGHPATNPPAQWYHEVRDLNQYVDDTAQVFLGVRVGCARCHHHPFEKFSQEDWYGLAGFFARVSRKGGTGVAERRANESIIVQATGEVRHPLTGQVVAPHGLGAEPLEIPPYEDPRYHLVDWMRRPDNPYFARALVNRLWAHFFSQGLVEPHDDLRVTNPPTNEPLLDALADEFVRSKFDMRHIIRLICTSATYQLSSEAHAFNLEETQAHSRFYPQRLRAEPLLNALDEATGSPTKFAGLPPGTQAIQLPDENFSNSFLTLFGRPPRESACECEREASPNLSQALFMMNDGFLRAKVDDKTGLAAQLATSSQDLREAVDELFLRTLCRPPNTSEMERAVGYLQSEPNRDEAYRDLLWVLVNTKEFLFIH